jgi:hypothetical protein
MSHSKRPFVNFDPSVDRLAALKVAIDSILVDNRLDDLVELLTPDHRTGGLEGDPGWIVERKDRVDTHAYNEQWPEWASFRAFVDPAVYRIAEPECFLDRKSFLEVATPFLQAYARTYPVSETKIASLLAAFASKSQSGVDPL